MLLSIDQPYTDIDKRIACEIAFLHCLVDSLLDAWDITLRYGSALYFVCEFILLSALERVDVDDNTAELPMSTGLLLVGVSGM